MQKNQFLFIEKTKKYRWCPALSLVVFAGIFYTSVFGLKVCYLFDQFWLEAK